jgi:hypothetical protein
MPTAYIGVLTWARIVSAVASAHKSGWLNFLAEQINVRNGSQAADRSNDSFRMWGIRIVPWMTQEA